MGWLSGIGKALRIERFLPFTHEGRQTLVYVVMAGSGPALTLCVLWAMRAIRNWTGADAEHRLDAFAVLANIVAAALLIIVIGLAMFVSIRAIRAKISKDGIDFDATGGDGNAG